MIIAKLEILFLYLCTFLLLWLGYAIFIVPVYGYAGFNWSPNILKLYESILLLIFFGLYLPAKVKRPSDFFIHMHFLFPIITMLVLYAAADYPRLYIYMVVISFLTVCFVRKIKIPFRIKGIISSRKLIYIFFILSFAFIVSIILLGGLRYFNLNIWEVYEYRSVSASHLPKLYGYFRPWFSSVILPFTFIVAFHYRKWPIASAALFGSIMIFALTHHKGPLFYPFFILGIYLLIKRNQERVVKQLIAAYSVVVILSLVPFGSLNETIGSLMLRRAFFVPANLNFIYYDYFSVNAHTLWAQNRITFGLLDYPYDLNAVNLIGYYAYNRELCSANTGWIGSGYMHFGLAGMFFYAVIIGLLLKIVDKLSTTKNNEITISIFSISFMNIFTSSDLPTSLLTHGFLLLIFIFAICRFDFVQRVNLSLKAS